MKILIFISSTAFCLLSALSHASSAQVQSNCWENAGKRYRVDPLLLYAMAEKESAFNPFAVNARSADEDVGIMQINSFWYPHLEKHGIARDDLFDACTSIFVGAWVLAQSMEIFGNTWEAVGAYNVGTSREPWAYKARKRYYEDVYRRYHRIVSSLR